MKTCIAILILFSMFPMTMAGEDTDSLAVIGDTLSEAGIVESRVTRRADRNVYTILPSDRLKSYDMNTLLDRLPGIGGYFASKMVEYRHRLGGSYSYKEQLMDIWRFDREKFDGLSDLVAVGAGNVRPYPLWTLPEDSLKLHPYIGPYAARGIVLYRENNPKSLWTVEALAGAGVLKSEMAAKLSRCSIEQP